MFARTPAKILAKMRFVTRGKTQDRMRWRGVMPATRCVTLCGMRNVMGARTTGLPVANSLLTIGSKRVRLRGVIPGPSAQPRQLFLRKLPLRTERQRIKRLRKLSPRRLLPRRCRLKRVQSKTRKA